MGWRPRIALGFVGLWALAAHACSAEPAAQGFEPECTTNQFRACQTEEGIRGSQQCVEPGTWNPCNATVLDAAYPDVPKDVVDAETD